MNRKTNKAKRVSKSCRNHGSCVWCRGNRTAANRRRIQSALDAAKGNDK